MSPAAHIAGTANLGLTIEMQSLDADVAEKTESALEVGALLGETPARPWWRRPLHWAAALALITLIAAAPHLHRGTRAQGATRYVTEPVERGNVALKVTANGTLQPTRTVNIGSELSGTVARVLVDVNDHVRKGQVLLELDTSKLRDQIARSRATVASTEAKVAQALASVSEARSSLQRLEEVQKLSGGKVPSQTDLEAARAKLERAIADEASARASVTDAKAALSSDETNLAKASIRSSIDGVVLSRAVEPGSAVAASLQAVTLFTIAEDLTQMRLQVNVDEADVGMVKAGQNATFTVSSYPDRKYPAKITRVAYGSTTTDNVVTYITYLDVENKDLTLRPGMTATATIDATERRDVLLVPNTALRYRRDATSNGATSDAKATAGSGLVSKLLPRPPGMGQRRGSTGEGAQTPSAASENRQVWLLNGDEPRPIAVRTGLSDGKVTEIANVEGQDIALQPSMRVIVDETGAQP